MSFQKQLLGWLPAVLAGIALCFALIAAWLGRWMARQAIHPLREAYLRQKRLTADTSHELRTPLSVLLASIEALELEEGVAGQAFAERLTARMKGEVQRMSRLTGDLLILSRLESGQEVFTSRPFNMTEAAREAIAALTHLAGEKGVTLELEAEPELPVRLDREKVVQLLVILLENAVKYTPEEGSVRLKMGLTGRRGGERVLLEVVDTGCGIAEEGWKWFFSAFTAPICPVPVMPGDMGWVWLLPSKLQTLIEALSGPGAYWGKGVFLRQSCPCMRRNRDVWLFAGFWAKLDLSVSQTVCLGGSKQWRATIIRWV